MLSKNNKPIAISPSRNRKTGNPLEILRSNQNPTIRRLAGLRNHRRRRAAGVILVDGARESLRGIAAGFRLLGFYEPVSSDAGPGVEETEPLQQTDDLQRVRAHAIEHGVYRGVAPKLFPKICYGEAADRCLAELEAPGDTLADLPALPPGLILVLDQVEKPGNLGAIFRSADAAGVSAVLLSECPSDRFNPNAIRGSLGAVFTVPSAKGSQSEIADFLALNVDEVLAMRVEGSHSLYQTNLRADGPRGRIAVVLGSESDGLGDRWEVWQKKPDAGQSALPEDKITGIHLPMAGQIDSLNVSVSAALLAFECVRQRSQASPDSS